MYKSACHSIKHQKLKFRFIILFKNLKFKIPRQQIKFINYFKYFLLMGLYVNILCIMYVNV